MTILVTGGAGFIGSNFILSVAENSDQHLVNIDKLTYAGNLNNLRSLEGHEAYRFIQGDICDSALVSELLRTNDVTTVVNFAAESHVDRSIDKPDDFITTNIVGTFNLLECAKNYWNALDDQAKSTFRFLHVSTDEVYGSLTLDNAPFTETNAYCPNSPYSASKAAADHLVRSYYHTYGLPVLTTNCSNNYGPYQFPEKLIPLVVTNALADKPLPLYGDGQQIRDWLYVVDHCEAIEQVIARGKPGETYNIGGINEKTNLEVVTTICETLDRLRPKPSGSSYKEQITFVKDRPGHDRRYAIDATKIAAELGWAPKETFESGLHKTVSWYLDNEDWIDDIISGEYRDWVKRQYS